MNESALIQVLRNICAPSSDVSRAKTQEVSNKNSASDVRHSADHCELPSGCASTTASTSFRYFSLTPAIPLCARTKFMQFSHGALHFEPFNGLPYFIHLFRVSHFGHDGKLFFVLPFLRCVSCLETKGDIFLFIYHSDRRNAIQIYARVRFFLFCAHNATNESNESAHAAIYFYTHVFLLRNALGTVTQSEPMCRNIAHDHFGVFIFYFLFFAHSISISALPSPMEWRSATSSTLN